VDRRHVHAVDRRPTVIRPHHIASIRAGRFVNGTVACRLGVDHLSSRDSWEVTGMSSPVDGVR
jgi:hypothetical protein